MPKDSTTKQATDIIPSILDREIESIETDAFGHRHFADALRGLIEDGSHEPPFSIGLLGGWGTGKSSVKSLYIRALKDSTGKGSRSERIHTITFNAWRFGGEDIRRALLRDVFVQLGGDETAIYDHFFSQTSRGEKVARSLRDMVSESWQRHVFNVLQLLFYFAVIIGLAVGIGKLLDITAEENFKWLVAVFAAFTALALKVFEKAMVSRYTDVTKVELPKASAEQYEKLLLDQLKSYRKEHSSVERIIIFVDDLDRLSSEEMVSGLDAIRTLMEMPMGKCGVGIVFIISCDEDLVAEALSKRSRQAPELPGAISSPQVARRYLDRIFQFRLEIPQLPRQDMRAFAKELLARDCFSQIVRTVESAGSTIDEVVSRMIHVGVRNPRKTIQIVNAFACSMWIAIKREFEGTSSTKAGALTPGAVTSHPVSLAVLSAVKVDFPEFYSVLQTEPGCLDGFIRIFVRGEDPENLPGSLRTVLSQFLGTQPTAENPEWKLGDKHGPLRQFVSGVQSVQFPASLQPLILLNQDEVTRRTGDAGARLYDPVVSGDVQGVLKVLGRDADNRPLLLQEVEALANVWELVLDDSQDRKENAAAVLAALLSRCDETQRRKLAIPIAPTISGSLQLRGRVGLDEIRTLLPLLKEHDRQSILDQTAKDFGIDDDLHVTALAETGKALTLEQAIELVPRAAELLLDAWESGTLKTESQNRLANWLVDRNVFVSDKAKKVLPFLQLDIWVGRFEALLLPRIGAQYAAGVIAELNARTPSLVDKDAAIDRLGQVLDQLGPQTSEFWTLSTEMCALADTGANQAAQSRGRANLGKATAGQIDAFAVALAERVTKYADEDGLDDADTDAADLLKSICSQFPTSLVTGTEKIADTCIALSQVEVTAEQSVAMSQALHKVSKAAWERVMGEWLPRMATDLPISCSKELGSTTSRFEAEPLKTARAEALAGCFESAEQRDFDALNAFWSEAQTGGHIGLPGIKEELRVVLTNMAEAHGDFEATKPIWDSYRIAIRSEAGTIAGTQLNSLSSNAVSVPQSYASFMEFMSLEWDKIAKYSPLTAQDSAARAVKILPSLAGTPGAATLLTSLNKLVSVADLTEAERDEIVAAVLSIWASHPPEATLVAETLAERLWGEEMKLICEAWASMPDVLAPFARRLISATMKGASAEEALEIVPTILAISPISSSSVNDSGLKAFVESLDQPVARSLISYVADESNARESRLRMLEKLSPQAAKAPVHWLISFFGAAAELGASGPSAVAVSQVKKDANETARFGIAEQLLTTMVASTSSDAKRALAGVVAEISGSAPAESMLRAKRLAADDIVILAEQFPGSRKLKAARKKLADSSA